ncbi:MAG: hypothetical protein V4465_00485 [Patescibacteria group bacterium]
MPGLPYMRPDEKICTLCNMLPPTIYVCQVPDCPCVPAQTPTPVDPMEEGLKEVRGRESGELGDVVCGEDPEPLLDLPFSPDT